MTCHKIASPHKLNNNLAFNIHAILKFYDGKYSYDEEMKHKN